MGNETKFSLGKGEVHHVAFDKMDTAMGGQMTSLPLGKGIWITREHMHLTIDPQAINRSREELKEPSPKEARATSQEDALSTQLFPETWGLSKCLGAILFNNWVARNQEKDKSGTRRVDTQAREAVTKLRITLIS